MSLPSPGLTVPTLSNDQVSFNGVTFGNPTLSGLPFGIVSLEGLGKAKIRSGNQSRPRTRGSFVGLNLLDTRTITMTLDIGPPFGSYSTLGGALAAVRAAVSTEGTTEVPLWVQLPNFGLVACMARVTAFDPKYDTTADLGGIIKATPIQFEATDPYFYAAPTGSTTLGLAGPSGGFSFPISFPLSFGNAVGANQATITNAGDVPCWPVLVITGPCLNPSVQNQSIAGNPTLAFNIQLNAGDQLVVDCDLQSILYFPSGAPAGSPEPGLLTQGVTQTFFSIAPDPTANDGANVILFASQDTAQVAGTLQVWASSAYSGLL